eukprot:6206692-Pleurochrysis_carterae.AAC.1
MRRSAKVAVVSYAYKHWPLLAADVLRCVHNIACVQDYTGLPSPSVFRAREPRAAATCLKI